ncbi:saccharopine dehydrogenase NADP-binding domain-containing protein, partial [bacterium]|nr:saccharopine dehydrogenase NADP-binding domain-containing protein [bacterium]
CERLARKACSRTTPAGETPESLCLSHRIMSSVSYRYLVLGSGRQGTAAAYDLCKQEDTESVIVADAMDARAENSCNRINRLTARNLAAPQTIDVKNRNSLISLLQKADVAISAVPYYHNLEIANCAVEAKTSLCDLGGNTEIVFRELELDPVAKQKGITIVPDCGMVPGLGTSMCTYAMSLVDEPQEVFLWDGGIPKNPRPPWNYILTFHFEGLVNEYFGTTEFLRDGKIVNVPCFEEYELVDFPEPIGQLEAFTTAGGTSTGPRTFLGRLKTYQNKTLRYKGHYQNWKTFNDTGLLETKPVMIDGSEIRPRDFLQKILEPQIRAKSSEEDVCIIRATCIGKDNQATVDLFDYYDSQTEFTSMERTTGFHIAIMARFIAQHKVPAGVVPVELAVPGSQIAEECRKRGMIVTAETKSLDRS